MFDKIRKIDEGIKVLQSVLKGSFVSPSELEGAVLELKQIDGFLKEVNQSDQGACIHSKIHQYREELTILFGRLHTLFVDAEITSLAEQAQKAAENTDVEAAARINSEVIALQTHEAFSSENRIMIGLIRRFLAQALGELRLDEVHAMPMTVEMKESAGMMLFEIAHLMYQGKVKVGMNQLHLLQSSLKEQILRHFQKVGGCLKALESDSLSSVQQHSFKLIQAILATISEIVHDISDQSYPSLEEVNVLFSE